jgi:putative ABC transport system permease protein
VNLASLSASYLRARPLQTTLSLLLLALGAGTIVMLLLVVSQLEERMGRDARGIDLVVGAKGSPMQLILAGIYHLDAPTGNIPLPAAQSLAKHRFIRKAMPLALGDSWKGFRIVGAGHEYVQHYGGQVSGRLYEKPMEAVLGAEAASRSGLGVGGRFVGAHGIGTQGEEHGDPYTVVGVLQKTGTVLDRLVLTSIESVWHVHEKHEASEEREVTVLLLQYASPLAAATLPRQVNAQSELQAASPAYETARLFRIVGVGVEALRAFALVLMLAAGLSVFIALYTALEERRYDLAVMRALGASPARLFGLLVFEGLLLALAARQQYAVSGLDFHRGELWVVAAATGIGIIAAAVPAWRAYRTDVSRTLAQG